MIDKVLIVGGLTPSGQSVDWLVVLSTYFTYTLVQPNYHWLKTLLKPLFSVQEGHNIFYSTTHVFFGFN